VTEWNEFRNPDFAVMRGLLNRPVIFDGRNLYDPARMAAMGITYHGIGRAPAPEPAEVVDGPAGHSRGDHQEFDFVYPHV
jgi:UDPglucose 6-dehydrogenase